MAISPEQVDSLAKAELHLHIEGTLEPELMFELGRRNGIQLPYQTPELLRAAYAFDDLQAFLDLYYLGVDVLQNDDDFTALADAYFAQAVANNIRRAEIFFDPQAHTARGIPIDTVMQGLNRACATARHAGLEVAVIACMLRHLPERDALKTLEQIAPYQSSIIGIGLDSSELGYPPRLFARVFEQARSMGFRLMAHAGEEGPAEYVWEALDVLGVERIDHGNRAMDDAVLVQRLAREQIPLTVCPLSNLQLRVVEDLRSHPLKAMLDAGLLVTVNSDDPAYFGGYLNENYLRIAQALDLTITEIKQLADNSFRASFSPSNH